MGGFSGFTSILCESAALMQRDQRGNDRVCCYFPQPGWKYQRSYTVTPTLLVTGDFITQYQSGSETVLFLRDYVRATTAHLTKTQSNQFGRCCWVIWVNSESSDLLVATKWNIKSHGLLNTCWKVSLENWNVILKITAEGESGSQPFTEAVKGWLPDSLTANQRMRSTSTTLTVWMRAVTFLYNFLCWAAHADGFDSADHHSGNCSDVALAHLNLKVKRLNPELSFTKSSLRDLVRSWF